MFEALTSKFNGVFRKLSGRGRISEQNVREAMGEVRQALLEADVNYQVVRKFCDDVTGKAVGTEVIKSLHPGQMMVKLVHDELVDLMGPVDTRIYYVTPPPTILLMAGLQGSGKTTTCGKLAKFDQLCPTFGPGRHFAHVAPQTPRCQSASCQPGQTADY